jgi:hypothetical protein
MDVTDLFTRGTVTLAGGFFSALDEPGIGDEVLNAWESPDVVDLIENDEGEDLADAMYCAKEMEGIGVVPICGTQEIGLEPPYLFVQEIDELEVQLDALADTGVGELLDHPVAVDLVGDLTAELREIALAVGILDVAEQIGPTAYEVGSTSEQISGSAHLSWIDVGLGDHAAAQESGDLAGVDLVVLGFAPMNGFHVKSVAQDEGDAFVGAQVSDPVPGEDALNCDGDVVTVGCDGSEEWFRLGGDVSVEQDLSVPVENAEVHGSSVEIDTTIVTMFPGVESHEASSFLGTHMPAYPVSTLAGRPQ